MNWDQIINEVTTTLQDLIRFDTTNPPGNETPCIEYIAAKLKREGIEPVVLESAPTRGNLVARLKGDGSLPPLLLMGHVDVVPAEADKWQRAPFSGDLIDGIVWGRGATDMKQMVAMELIDLSARQARKHSTQTRSDFYGERRRRNRRTNGCGLDGATSSRPDPRRVRDQRRGRDKHRPRQPGLLRLLDGGKGSARFTLRTHGEPGHASQPNKNNALLPLSRAVANLIETPLPLRVCKSARAHVEAMARGVDGALRENVLGLLDPVKHESALAALPLAAPVKRRLFAALHNTAVPTILKAGSKINVIPGEAECQVDCRILPGTTLESLEQELRAVIGQQRRNRIRADVPRARIRSRFAAVRDDSPGCRGTRKGRAARSRFDHRWHGREERDPGRRQGFGFCADALRGSVNDRAWRTITTSASASRIWNLGRGFCTMWRRGFVGRNQSANSANPIFLFA